MLVKKGGEILPSAVQNERQPRNTATIRPENLKVSNSPFLKESQYFDESQTSFIILVSFQKESFVQDMDAESIIREASISVGAFG